MNSGSALIARITKPFDFLAQKTRREKIYRALWDRAVLNPIKTLVRPLTAGLLFGLALGVIAAPQGGNVTAGSGTISTPDAHTTVVKQNSNNLVVHWNSFNLAQDETVRFRQPSVQSQALNRIFDQNPSQIHGRINANGRVLLVNPSGIFFSPTARVNVGALIASGLSISEQDFMRGKYNFSPAATGEGGVIINRGLLQAATGGSINLIGGAVSNEGMILAEAGQVNLGAGRRATIDFDGDGLLRFSVDEEILANAHNLDAAVSNSGEIKAEGGSVLLTAKAAQDVFSQVVNNSGVISAGRIQKQDGEIKLIAGGAGSSVLNTGTLDTSSGHSNGGRIGIEAGGSITLAEDALDGTGVENSDPAPSGQDEIVLQTPAAGEPADQGSLLLGSEIEISADSVNLGGEVNVDGASGGTIGVEAGDQIVLNATLSGLGETGQGGQVELIGMDVDINRQAHIDVSGLLGGGTIQVGGSERGGDLRGRRAKELTVEEGARFDADALERGDGGRVIFWSDATRFAGHIQALGGPLGGNGGFAEVSGHHLWMTGHADLRAPQGDWGELLLDPGTVTICEDGAMGCVDDPVGAPADTFTDTFINTRLETVNLTISTADATSPGAQDINLTDTVNLNWTTAGVLTLMAGNDINLAGSITAMGGTLNLMFGNQLNFAGASVGVGTVMATGAGTASILQGPATGANIWTVTGADAGTLEFGGLGGQNVSFSSVGNLNGGAGADTFTLNAALTGNIEGGDGDNDYDLNDAHGVGGSITGGADADVFRFNTTVLGMVDGAGGTNTLDYSGGSNTETALTGLGGTTGFAGTASRIDGGFDDITNLVGRGTTDSLQGLDADATFTLASAGNTYISGGRTLDFSNIENLQGGSMADTFEVSAAYSGNLIGGDGNDIFNVRALLTGNIFGEAGMNTYNMLGTGSVTGLIGGVGGSSIDTLDFSGMSSQVDVTLTGLGSSTEGFAGMSNVAGTFDNIITLIGGSNLGDSLTGLDADATFTLASAGNMYESGGRTLGFGAIENLIGGSMADTFNVNVNLAGNIEGGAGNNIYNLNNGGSVMGITAGAGDEIFNINGFFTADLNGQGGADTFNVNEFLLGNIEGGAGDDTFILGDSGLASGGLDGGADTDTFQGRNVASTFNIAGVASTYEATGGGFSRTFSNIENLRGGSAADTFTVTAAHSGNLQGGGGADVFMLTDVLTGSIEGGAGANIYNLNSGGSVTGGGITAGADDETFNINAAYTLDLDGLGGADTFNVGGSGALTGVIVGGAGANIYNFNGGSVDGLTASGAGATETFNINADTTLSSLSLDGGVGTDIFNLDAVLTGSISGGVGSNTYNLNSGGGVSGTITGGANLDTFVFDGGSVTGMVDGADGVNELNYNALSSQVDVVLTGLGGTVGFDGTAPGTGGFNDITNLVGGTATSDTLLGLDAVATFTLASGGNTYESTNMLGFSNIEDLQGGNAVDTFTVSAAHSGTLLGGAGNDIFTLTDALTGTIEGEAGDNTYNLDGGGSVSLGITGGDDADTFVFNGGSVTGLVDGAGGVNELNYNALGSQVDVVLTGLGGTTGFDGTAPGTGGFNDITNLVGGTATSDTLLGLDAVATFTLASGGNTYESTNMLGFSNIEDLQGGNAVDTFTVSTAHSGTLSGGDGNDIFTLTAALTGGIAGEAGDNVFNLSGGGGSISGIVDLAADSNNFWYHTAGETLTTATDGVTGTGSLFIPDIDRGTLTIGTGDLILPDLTGFTGHLVIGGIINPLAAPPSPYYVNPVVGGVTPPLPIILVNTQTLTVAGITSSPGTVTRPAIETGGPVTLLARNINLNNDITAGGMIGLVAAATVAGEGLITLGGGEVTLTAPASTTRPSGAFIASNFVNPINLVLAFSGGEVDIAVGSGVNIQVSGSSDNAASTDDPDFQTFIDAISTPGTDRVRICTSAACLFDPDAVPVIPVISLPDVVVPILTQTFVLALVTTPIAGTLDFSGMTTQVDITLTGLGSTLGFAGMSNVDGDFDDIINLIGGSNLGDSLTGLDEDATFTLASAGNTYMFGGRTLDFSGIENLLGGSMADTFNVGAAFAGTISGRAGANVYNLNSGGSLTGAITGGADTDDFVFNGGSVTGMIDGAGGVNTLDYTTRTAQVAVTLTGLGGTTGFAGTASQTGGFNDITNLVGGTATTDTLQGRDADATFNLAATNNYMSGGNTLMFSAIEDLQGGSMADTFTVSAAHSGNLRGGAGANIYDLNSGGSVSGTITAGDGDEMFNINAAYTLDLDGLGGADTFNIASGGDLTGTIVGGAGANMYNFNGGSVDGLTAGGAGATETFNINADTTLSTSLDGGVGTDIFNIRAVLMGSISGGVGSNTYNLNGGGSVSGTITGGINLDAFVFNGGSVTGVVDGAGGTNTLDYNTRTAQVAVTLTGLGGTVGFAGTSSQTGGFNDITNLVGGSATSDSLTGQDQVATFTVNTANGGTYGSQARTLGFSNIESLTGGAMADTFAVNAALAGSITGGDGANLYNLNAGGSVAGGITAGGGDEMFNINGAFTADLNGQGGADTFNLNAALTGLVEGGAGDDTFILGAIGPASGGLNGGLDSDTLQGRDIVSTFNIAGVGNTYEAMGGAFIQAFSNIENLQGGSAADTFTVSAAHSGNLQGGGGADVFTLMEVLTGSIEGGAGANIYNLNSGGSVSGTITAGDGDEMFNINAAYNLDLDGLGGADTFNVGSSGDLTGTISGGVGANIYNFNGGSVDGLTAGGGGVTETFNINADTTLSSLDGGAGTDIFNIGAVLTGSISGGVGSNTYNLNGGGSVSGTITGGINLDAFVFNGGSVTGVVDGAGGTNTLDYNTRTAQVAVTLTGLGGTVGFAGMSSQTGGFDDITNLVGGSAMTDSLTGQNQIATFTVNTANGGTYDSTNVLGFSNIESLTGGTMADTFTVGAALAGSITGGGGANVYNLNTGSVAGGITAGGGDEMFNINGAFTADLNGQGGADTFTVDAVLTGLIQGGVGDDTFILGDSGSASGGLDGGLDSDTFQGRNIASTFNVAGGSSTYQTTGGGFSQVFSNIENLRGGTMADTFTVSAAHNGNLQGGDGADVFTLTDALTGSIEGGTGANIYNLESGGSVSAGITAGADDETFNINADYTLNLDGLGGADTFNMGAVLTGNIGGGAGDNTYNLNMNGQVTGTITGGVDADDFVFGGGSVTGMIDGAEGVNTLDYNALGSQVQVALTGLGGTVGFVGTASETGGFDDITNLVGGTATTDTLQGLDAVATFTVNTANGGTYESTNVLDFSNIESLTGGTMADTFAVSAALAGSIIGGDGANIYTLNAGSVAGGITAGGGDEMFNINGAFTADLNGQGGADTFTVNEVLTGLIEGGAGDDTFVLGVSGSANNLDGGADSDTFQGRNVASTFNVAGAASTYEATGGFSQTFSNIENLRGGSAADTFTVTAAHNGSIEGGAGANVYNLNSGGSLNGSITAGGGDEEFNINADYTLNLDGLGGADTFNMGAVLTGNIEGGAGDNTYNLNMNGQVTGGITGGTNVDNFVFNGGSVTGMIDGAGGVNTLDYTTRTVQVAVALTGLGGTVGFDGTATDTGGFNGITNLVGGSAMTDSLTGQDQIAAFTVNTANGGTYESTNMLGFSGIESLTGGTMADTFTVGAALAGSITGGLGANIYTLNTGSVAGGIIAGGGDEMFNINGAFTADLNGQGGADTFTVAAVLTGLIEGGAGDDTFILGDSGSASGGLDGGLDSDTFQGRNIASTFNVAGGSSTYQTTGGGFSQVFSNIENLRGGTMADTFTVSAAHNGNLQGGDGADVFTLTDALTGSIEGGTGANIYNLESGGSVSAGITAGADDETFNINADYTLNLDGLGGADTFNMGAVLTGNIGGGAGDNTYNLNMNGQVTGTITGGVDADDFVFGGGSVTGMIDGAEGVNTLDYNALGSQVQVALTGLGGTVGFVGTASETGGFDDITNLVGGTATTDTLQGLDAVATFTVNTANGGTYESTNVLDFSNIESLTGGTMADTFTVDAALAGSIIGGAGANIYTLNAGSVAGGITAGGGDEMFNINGAFTADLNGQGGADTFTVGAALTGLIEGGAGANIYNLNTGGSVTGGITAGGGDEMFNINGAFTADLNGQGGADTFTVGEALTGLIEGGAGANIYNLNSGGSVSGAITGGADADTFVFDGGSVTGMVDGAGGVNELNYNALVSQVDVVLTGLGGTTGFTGTASQTGGFDDITNLVGGTATSDSLQGLDAVATFTLASGGNTYMSTNMLGFSNIEDLQGGNAVDTFTVSAGHSGTLSGGAGNDIFTLTAALTGGIVGEAGDNIYNLDGGGSVSAGITGGDDTDTFVFDGGSVAGMVDGAGGVNELNYNALSSQVDVVLTGLGGTVGFAGTASQTGGFDDITNLVGGTATSDSLQGLDAVATFTLASGGNTYESTNTLGFSNIEDLQGGNAVDTFTVSAGHSGTLSGGAGNDIFTLTAALTGGIEGEAGDNIYNLNSGGSVSQGITGGADADTFVFDGGSVAGMVDGAGGVNELNYNALSSQVAVALTGLGGTTGFAGTASQTGGFDDITNLVGGTTSDSLQGLDAVATFTLASTGNTYESTNTLDFSNIEDLQGGSMADTFTVSAAHSGNLQGGGGADVFTLTDALTGSIEGGAGANVYNLNSGGSVSAGITAGADDETFNINADYTLNLDGLGGADTFNMGAVLTGNIGGGAGDNTYNLNMNGEVTGTITGGTDADDFVFDGGSVTGMIDGAGGVNTLDYNALASQVDITLTGLGGTVGFDGTATDTGGFNDITDVVGGTAITDTLLGLDAIATFTLASTGNTYESTNTLDFSNIEDLQGGSMADTFTVSAAHSGNLQGGNGADVFTLQEALTGSIEGGAGANIYNLESGGSVTGGITAGADDETFNINAAYTLNLDGLGGADTFNMGAVLTGNIGGGAGDNTYNLNMNGEVTGTITGGADADDFVFDGGSVTGTVDGAGGVNTLDYNALASQVDVTLTGLGGTVGFDGTATDTGGFNDITDVVGGTAMTDTLQGRDADATFNLAAINNYMSGGNTLMFSAIEDLQGGSMIDTFIVSAAHSGTLSGGAGNDIFTLTAALTGTIAGEAGDNTYNLDGGGSVSAGITGGADADTFVFNGGSVTGLVDGAGGVNTLDYNQLASQVDITLTGTGSTTGFDGTATGTGGFDDITNLVGGTATTDTLQGRDADATFNLAATNNYMSGGNTLMFSNIEDLQGGNAVDTFTVSAGHSGTLSGGAGADIFTLTAALTGTIAGEAGDNTYNLDGGGSVSAGITGGDDADTFVFNGGSVTGLVDGAEGVNTLDYNQLATQVDIVLTGLGGTTGFIGSATGIMGPEGFDDITSVVGGDATTDTLQGRDADATFNLAATNNYMSGGNTLMFSAIEDLQGGSMIDTFIVSAAHSGTLSGGAGNDIFTLTAALTGTIAGEAGDNTYNLDGGGSVSAGITGGDDADTFVFNGGSVTGLVDGAEGVNTLDYNQLATQVDIVLTGLGGTTGFIGSATGIMGPEGFDDITSVVGGDATTDTLQGRDADATFNLAATNNYMSGGNTLMFSNIEDLQGGNAVDTFTVSAGHSGTLSGGAGADIFTLTAALTGTIAGEAGDNTYNLDGGGSVSAGITGGDDADTFVFNGGSVTGLVDGAEGVNTLDYNQLATQVDIVLTGLGGTTGFIGSATGIMGPEGFDDITSVVGGDATTDTLQGRDADATFNLAATNNYMSGGNTLMFSNIEDLQGGNAVDTFTVSAGHSGTLSGGAGADIFTLTAALTGTIAGEAGDNTYNLDGGGSVSAGITGGDDADTFVFNGGSVTGLVDGAEGVNTLDYNQLATQVDIVLTGLGGTTGFIGSATGIMGPEGFDDITSVVGGDATTDTLQGRDADATFNLAATNNYMSGGNTLMFSNIEDLQGGNAVDTFTVSAGHSGTLSGGAGADIFTLTAALTGTIAGEAGDNTYNLDGGGSVSAGITGGDDADTFVFNGGSVTGLVDGAEGVNTLDYNQLATQVDIVLTGLGGTTGFIGSATGIMGPEGFDDITSVVGGDATTDTLQGRDADATFNLAATNNYMSGANTLMFSNIEDLQGGNAVDTFTVSAGHSGTLSGGAGADIFTLTAALTGTIAGEAGDNTYNLDGGGSVSAGITGGDDADTFVFNGGSVTGLVDGAEGVNTLDYNQLATQVDIVLTGLGGTVGFDGTATDTGGFNDITNLVGGTATTDTLQGWDADATFNLATTNNYMSGGNTLMFSNIEDLQGGNAVDTFTVSAGHSGTLSGGAGADIFTLTAALTGTIAGEAGDNTYNLDGGGSVSAGITGGDDADTFVFNGGSVTGLVDGAEGVNTLDYNQLATQVDITLTGTGGTVGFDGTATDTGGFNDITNLVGGTATTDTLQGWDADATFNLAATNNYMSGGNTLMFSAIEDLQGGSMIDTFIVTAAHSGTLSGGAGNDIFTLTAALTGGIAGGAGDNVFNLSGGGGSISGIVTLAEDSNNYWYHTAGESLTTDTGSVTGTGSLFIPDIDRETLVIGTGDLILPDLTDFTGHLVIGGIISPLAAPTSPYYVGTGPGPDAPLPVILVNTDTLTVAGIIPTSGTTATRPAINTGGPVTLLARNINLNNDITAGGMIGLVAAATVAGEGLIALGGGEVTLTAPASTTRPSGAFIASDFDNPINLVLAFSGGEVGIVVGSGANIQVSGRSEIAASTDEDFQTFIAAIRSGPPPRIDANVPVRICTPATCPFTSDEVPDILAISLPDVVPIFAQRFALASVTTTSLIAELIGLKTVASIDTGLFEEDLTLYGQIGTGIALALAQCEEQEGCAPNVTEEELDILISGLEEKVAQLESLLDEELDDDERPRIEQLLLDYNMLLRDFRQYRESLREFFAVEDEVEEEEIQSLEEELAPVPVQPGAVKKLTGILENIKSRLEWLEGLKSDPEALERLGERSNIDLTPEVLDAIIESTRSEAQFIEDSIRRFIEGVPGAGRIGNDRSILLIDRRDMRDIQRQYAQQVPISVSKVLQN